MGQTVSLPRISDLFILLPFEVFPPVRQPRGAQLRGAGRQPLLHEVDGRSRPGRLTRADLGPGPQRVPSARRVWVCLLQDGGGQNRRNEPL